MRWRARLMRPRTFERSPPSVYQSSATFFAPKISTAISRAVFSALLPSGAMRSSRSPSPCPREGPQRRQSSRCPGRGHGNAASRGRSAGGSRSGRDARRTRRRRRSAAAPRRRRARPSRSAPPPRAAAAPISRANSARPGPSAGAGAASIIGATDRNGDQGPFAASGSSQPGSPRRAASRSASDCRRIGKGCQKRRHGVDQRSAPGTPARSGHCASGTAIRAHRRPSPCRRHNPRPDAPPRPADVTSGSCRAA